MLTFYASKMKGPLPAEAGKLPVEANWIDAFDPTPDERAALTKLIGTSIPTLEDLLEIETSSRLFLDDGALVMSVPTVRKDETGYPTSTPLGFVVTGERVVTIRFSHLHSFEHLASRICEKGDLSEGGFGAAITVIEIMIDHIADLLERVGGDLDEMSRSIFSGTYMTAKARRPRRSNRLLTSLLEQVGVSGDLVSKVSETLLGLSRMAPFVAAHAGANLKSDLKRRIKTIYADTKSLHEHTGQLASKTQFLLDALLGVANIEQGNVFRVLTVVSIIGIPPTFIASMYGMNFKYMPELEWHYGYAFGIGLILTSAIVPALWFKIKGWW